MYFTSESVLGRPTNSCSGHKKTIRESALYEQVIPLQGYLL